MTTVKLRFLADPGNVKETTAEVESSFSGMGDAVTGIFQGIGQSLGGVFGGIAEQLSGALDIQKGQSKLQAQLGASSEDMAVFGKVAGELYAGAWGDSMDDVNNTVGQVFKNIGVESEEAIKQASILTTDFATTFEQDTDAVTRAVGQMLRTGLAENAEQAFDILTRGMQMGDDKAGDLLDTFNEYGTQFRKLGLDGSEAMGLISQAIQAGARDSDLAADALKEFSIRAIDGSKTTADAFEKLNLPVTMKDWSDAIAQGGDTAREQLGVTLRALKAIQDPAERSAAAVGLFGTQAEDLGDALYAMDPDQAVAALGDVEGSAQRMSDTLNDNVATTIESLKRQALMGLANILVNQVVPAFYTVKDAIVATVGFFTEHKDLAIALGIGIAAVLVPALIASAAALWANVAALLAAAAPIIATVAVVAALAAGVIYAYEHWGWFKAAVDGVASFMANVLWPVLKSIAGWIVDTLVPTIAGIATHVWNFATDVYNAFNNVISFLWGLPGQISDIGGRMWNGLTDGLKGAINKLIEMWNSLDFSIPGFHGPFGIGWGGIGDVVPDIPYLAAGAIVRARPGGTLAVIGEGGRDEAVVPLPRGMRDGMGGGVTIINVNAVRPDRRTGQVIEAAVRRARSAGTRTSR